MIKAIRWWIFLRPIGVKSLWLVMKATFAGAGLNNVLAFRDDVTANDDTTPMAAGPFRAIL